MAEGTPRHAVAIIGMGGRFPAAADLDAFWRNTREGVEVLVDVSDADLEHARVDPRLSSLPNYVRKATVLEDAETFDAGFFGVPPREAQIIDPQQRVFLECAWEALEHAGYAGGASGQAVGVYAGAAINSYLVTQLLQNPPFVASVGGYQVMLGSDKDYLATRVSYKLDLRGPSITVQTACSTSLVAIVLACRALAHGECDLALAGGVSIQAPARAGYLFEEGMILSPDGHCRPFDAEAHGTRGSNGAGAVVLKRLEDALRDRDTIHAVVLGGALNNDGAGKAGYTAPSIEGQVEVIAAAQALAGVNPRSITYVEAHGTGTQLGDPIEIAALTQAFRAATPDIGFCRLGSLKASLGHLDAAAGVGGVIKATLALEHAELPPLVNFRSPNPALALETSPFVASNEVAPWVSDGPRRAGVSAFGIGGTNAHLVLEQAPAAPPPEPARSAELLVLSARSSAALERSTARLAAHLRAHPDVALADVAFTLGVGRRALAHRRAVVARDALHAAECLEQAGRPPVLSGTHEGAAPPVAFLFSGQGSQHAGMGRELYAEETVFRDAFDRCAAILEPELGFDLRKLVFAEDSKAALDETATTQPALFAVEYALASLWLSWGVKPAAMLGHSIGEYVAAHLAGVMSLEDALKVVAARGRLMQQQPPGGMAAVHLAPNEIERFLESGVEIAAQNAPGLCALSGPRDVLARVLERMAAAGIESRPLHTSHAFHSAMMEPALAPFLRVVESVKLSAPSVPYVSNLTGTWITTEQATSPSYYADHLRRAVKFEAGVRTLSADPSLLLLEVGPGNALASLARLTLGAAGGRRVIASLSHPRERRPELTAMLEAAGRAWLGGVELAWKGVEGSRAVGRVPLPTYPFERQRYWVDPVDEPVASQRSRPSAKVGTFLYAPTWTRDDSTLVANARVDGVWLVLGTEGPLASAVTAALAAAGADPVFVEAGAEFAEVGAGRFRARPGNEEDLARVVQAAGKRGPLGGALHLWSMDATAANARLLCYESIVALAAAIEPASRERPLRVIVATAEAESVLDERSVCPEAASVVGPAIVLPVEVPTLGVRAVDFDASTAPVATTARALVEEAAATDAERLVARRRGRRWVRRLEPLALPPAEPGSLPLKRGGVYLVTGGLGGLGLTLSRWLAAEVGARLVLTARTAVPPRETWDEWLATHPADERSSENIRALREIEKAGGEVLVVAAAAEDEAAMRGVVAQARARFGTIDGVLHAAGSPGSGKFALGLRSAQEVDATFAPKVAGLAVLSRILGDTPLDFVVLFSSMSAIIGSLGLCDYAAANAVLDAFAESAQPPASWKRVIAMDFGPWRDVGMAAKLVVPEAQRAAREAFMRTALGPAEGVDAFARALASGRSRVVITPFDVAAALGAAPEVDHLTGVETPASVKSTSSAVPRPNVSATFAAPESEAEQRMAAIWSELLGVDGIGVHDDFFELGGHSLLATRVLARVDQTFGARLTLRDIFDAPTIRRLSEKVTALAPAGGGESEREEIEF
ncbi:MAG TPA: SDR family NAD(P)-dependent oxidoreductase [Polyangiaceae bacterium]|nr:SDR family NAD(P)-dependent oxidoreductase [Polyangiaceae bacterium]